MEAIANPEPRPDAAVVTPVVLDSPSFAEFYRELFPSMVKLAYALTGSRATAEDLVQDAFVKVHRRWASVRTPQPYLRRAVVNACRSSYRKHARERRVLEGLAEQSVALGADELFDVLALLPYRQRAAVVMRFYEGLGDAQIADVLGCREGTVASLVHRALARLRTVIE